MFDPTSDPLQVAMFWLILVTMAGALVFLAHWVGINSER